MRLMLILLSILFSSTHTMASEAVGFYSSGSLNNSVSIDEYKTPHLIKLFRNRKQIYGVKELNLALTELARYMKANFPSIEPMQIGDMAARNGGKIPRHKSHQNGLDADVVYYRINEKAQSASNTEWEEYFVYSGKLSKNFHPKRNWAAFKFLVKNNDVSRILVDGAIKRKMCQLARQMGELNREIETLRRLRIENRVHKTHFHLRLKCPSGSPSCVAQTEPPQGSGC